MKVYIAYHRTHDMHIAMTETCTYRWFTTYEATIASFNSLIDYDDDYTIEEWLIDLSKNDMRLIAEFSSASEPELFI